MLTNPHFRLRERMRSLPFTRSRDSGVIETRASRDVDADPLTASSGLTGAGLILSSRLGVAAPASLLSPSKTREGDLKRLESLPESAGALTMSFINSVDDKARILQMRFMALFRTPTGSPAWAQFKKHSNTSCAPTQIGMQNLIFLQIPE